MMIYHAYQTILSLFSWDIAMMNRIIDNHDIFIQSSSAEGKESDHHDDTQENREDMENSIFPLQ